MLFHYLSILLLNSNLKFCYINEIIEIPMSNQKSMRVKKLYYYFYEEKINNNL